MRTYKALQQNVFQKDEFKIVPIRNEDRYDIMQWRNEQLYHLRQQKPLTKNCQDHYFDKVIHVLFDQEHPNQILFSFLKNGKCIGYGGLVHINWIDKHAEISFIMNTALELCDFDLNWTKFLKQVEKVAFIELNFHKLFVYAFDLRPHLYTTLKKNNYFLDAKLKEHCLYKEKYIDVVIYSKISNL